MKRFVCLFITLIMMFSAVYSLAESEKINFVLGLEFGMPISEAALKTGFTYKTISDSTKQTYEEEGIYGSHYIYGFTTIADYEVFVTCHADAEDNICQISYSFAEDSYTQYEAIEATLSKYGTEPYQGGKPITHGITTETIRDTYGTHSYKIIDSFDRIIPYRGGSVLIEHCYYTHESYDAFSGSSFSECHILCYSFIDAELAASETTIADF